MSLRLPGWDTELFALRGGLQSRAPWNTADGTHAPMYRHRVSSGFDTRLFWNDVYATLICLLEDSNKSDGYAYTDRIIPEEYFLSP